MEVAQDTVDLVRGGGQGQTDHRLLTGVMDVERHQVDVHLYEIAAYAARDGREANGLCQSWSFDGTDFLAMTDDQRPSSSRIRSTDSSAISSASPRPADTHRRW
ncbi:hypothetical protein [Streptomyces sp. NPDC054866]